MEKCNETLCWSCSNALGGCSWSQEKIPVSGWEAKETIHEDFNSYIVKKCPQYKFDKTELTIKQVALLLKCSERQLYRLSFDGIKQRLYEIRPNFKYELNLLTNGKFVLKRKL